MMSELPRLDSNQDRSVNSRVLCRLSYRGSAVPMLGHESLPERFWSKVVLTETGCWRWTDAIQSRGYGSLGWNGRAVSTHRFAYEVLVGPIAAGLQLDHLCRNRACCNPAHLEPVTAWENLHRSPITNATRTHCKHGHPLSGDNLIVKKRGALPPVRNCRACQQAQSRARRERKRSAS